MAETLTSAQSHDDPHPRPAEAAPGPSLAGTVAIEIGPGFGALVIRTRASMDGLEIEIRPSGTEWRGVHTAVRERHGGPELQYAAVFGSLAHGAYEVRIKGNAQRELPLTIQVAEGRVQDLVWPEKPSRVTV